jgi:hypothetical protein
LEETPNKAVTFFASLLLKFIDTFSASACMKVCLYDLLASTGAYISGCQDWSSLSVMIAMMQLLKLALFIMNGQR